MVKMINTILTVVAGIGAALVLYWVLNKLAELLPGQVGGPAQALPLHPPGGRDDRPVRAVPGHPDRRLQLRERRRARSSSATQNYTKLLTPTGSGTRCSRPWSGSSSRRWRPSCWASSSPPWSTGSALAARRPPRRSSSSRWRSARSAPRTVWRFVYAYAPAGQPQVGIQNAIVTALGFDPVAWLEQRQYYLNTMFLIIMFLWAQVGFSMVLLSAAIKGVPTDTVEAARVDGANERQIFRRVIFPQIMPHGRDRLCHGHHRRHEAVRHRLRDDERQLQHQRAGHLVLQRALHRTSTTAPRPPSS